MCRGVYGASAKCTFLYTGEDPKTRGKATASRPQWRDSREPAERLAGKAVRLLQVHYKILCAPMSVVVVRVHVVEGLSPRTLVAAECLPGRTGEA